MRRVTLAPLVFVLAACGGGSGGSDPAPLAPEPSAQELFRECLAEDAVDVAALLGALQGLFAESGAEAPQPEFDFVSGLLGGGVVPYTWDLDGDGTGELAGTVRFLDAEGVTTIPFGLTDLIGLEDPLDLLALAPDGTRLELTFALGGALLDPAAEAAGDGTLVFDLAGGRVATVSGEGTVESGPCLLDFSFDEVDATALDGIPVAGLAFDARIGDESVAGSLEFDGSSTAKVTARRNDGPEEQFEIEIVSG